MNNDFFWTYVLLFTSGAVSLCGVFFNNMPYFFCGLLVFAGTVYWTNKW